jgi:hypothetical protein
MAPAPNLRSWVSSDDNQAYPVAYKILADHFDGWRGATVAPEQRELRRRVCC